MGPEFKVQVVGFRVHSVKQQNKNTFDEFKQS